MRIDSLIRLSAEEWLGIPPEIRKRITVSLTYPNPKYAMTQRLGFSTHGIPRTIETYSLSADGFSCGRGEFRKVMNAIQEIPIPLQLAVDDAMLDVPLSTISYENKSFDLDERQWRCLMACSDAKQGVIHATTSAGKSAIIMALIAEQKQKTLVIVPRKLLLDQLTKDAKAWLKGCTIGRVAGGKAVWGDITFALERTLLKHLEEARGRFGMVLVDEAHVSSANTFQWILREIPARRRFGFTGTVKRKDGLEFLMSAAFGRIIAEVTKDEMLEAGRVSPVRVLVHPTKLSLLPEAYDLPPVKFWKAANDEIHKNASRIFEAKELVRDIAEKNPGGRTVVVSRHLEALRLLGEELEMDHFKVGYVTGATKDQEENCRRLERGEIDVLLVTLQCFSTGVNIPNLTDMILYSPVFNNELMLHQLRGRLMRKSEGKTEGRLHVMWDENVFPTQKINMMLRILKK